MIFFGLKGECNINIVINYPCRHLIFCQSTLYKYHYHDYDNEYICFSIHHFMAEIIYFENLLSKF